MVRLPGTTHDNPNSHLDSTRQGEEFIAQIQRKIDSLVQEFAEGQVTRAQFQRLYNRYQRQIATIQQLLDNADQQTSLHEAIFETEDTVKLKKRFTATPLGMRLYDLHTGQHIHTLGEFQVDDQLVTPLLYSCRAATSGSFRAGTRSAELENGEWLCFMPRQHTILITLFSLQPTDVQLETLEHMHEDFEAANLNALQSDTTEPGELVYPFYAMMQRQDRPPHIQDQEA
ncbi:MAG TPA: hypothetical protein PKD09_25550 [Aggregatilinea sp.]|jgi:hypothetical protein|uniref:hypothetical protein n=1 Tax=Aggregatilinea sp. TaxID=2806333 RepID=UPI002C04631F|nr:hypothetical protein [Aggregatilinea sp.]HML25044.1 hypothetical protein [Aggregatilinea sp.]